MARYIVEYGTFVNNYLGGGMIAIVDTKEEAKEIASTEAHNVYKELVEDSDYSGIELVNDGVFVNNLSTGEKDCVYITTVREME